MSEAPAAADVVIVGAGTAGSVLAARLSDDVRRRVVLIESGPSGSDPALRGLDYLAGAAADRFWNGGVRVERVAGQPARPYRSGRGIGGSAAVNGMVAMTPTATDFDAWAVAGCPSWTPDAVRPSLESVATNWVPTPAEDLGVLERALSAATDAAGFGSFEPVALERTGSQRASVAQRLLEPVLGRSNFDVLTGVAVARVNVDHGRATGVQFEDGSTLNAGEVVLAAGAIRTPGILSASGLADVATGGRLRDHPSGTFTLRLRDAAQAPQLQTAGVVRWRTPSGAIAEALPIARVGDGLAALAVGLMDPDSVGSVRLGAGGVLEYRLGMLSTDRDRTAMREVVAGALDLLAGAPMRALVAEVVTGDAGRPGESLRGASDEVLDAWVASSGPYLHAAGSCPLGTVLDEWGRVPGVSGLRVVDASALPLLPPVAPNATVTVLAAHIAANW